MIQHYIGLVKEAKKDDRTFPISRFMTHPATDTGVGALAGAGLERALNTIQHDYPHGGALGAIIGGGVGYGANRLSRWLYSRAMHDKLSRGGKGFTTGEHRLLLHGAKPGHQPHVGPSFPEVYTSPTTHAILGAARGSVAGPAGAVSGAVGGLLGQHINRHVQHRALVGRQRTGGHALTESERDLMESLHRHGRQKD